MHSKAEVPKLLWVRTHLGTSWPSRDPLNEMSKKGGYHCLMDCDQNMPIYGQRLEISIFKTVGI